MKKILGGLILGGLVAMVFSTPAFAEDEACCEGMKMGMHEKMMGAMHGGMSQKSGVEGMFNHKAQLIMENYVELGLSDEQRSKIKTLEINTKKSSIKNKAEIESLALDIEDALKKDEIDVNNVNALIDKKYSLKTQEAKTLVGAYAELKKALTKDQMKKLHEIWGKKKMDGGKCMMMEEKEKSKHKMDKR